MPMIVNVGCGSFTSFRRSPRHVRLSPDSDHIADVAALRICVMSGPQPKILA